MTRATVVLALALLGASACGQLRVGGGPDSAEPDPQLGELLRARRASFVTRDTEGARLWKLTRTFYERRGHQLAWIERRHPRPQMDAFLRALAAADQEGLDPEMYSLRALETRRRDAGQGLLSRRGFDAAEAATLDAWLTYLFLKYASDLADGLSDLAHADRSWRIEPEAHDPLPLLERALAENRVEQSLAALRPDAPQYRALRDGLRVHRELASEGGWPQLPPRTRLARGADSDSVRLLAHRLAISGDYKGAVPESGTLRLDAALVEAVKAFQRRHGLEPDGVVGPKVVAALNVPVEQRIEQIRLNLERWRWLPRELGRRHILVNIPHYHLEVREGDRVALAMRVVVGRADSPTPIFNDRMTYLVFSPYWNVPPDIARDETLPAMLQDARFLERNNMEVLDTEGRPIDPGTIDAADPTRYRFRQRPGTGNSLGLVKFMFPNQYHVYLHDTPADSLFARATRSFSHGCVRVEMPDRLAAYLLADQPEWTDERIARAMHAGEEQIVKLRTPVPVYLGYWTVWAMDEGRVHFAPDIYGIDARQARLVAERAARRKAAQIPSGAGGRRAVP